MQLSDKILEIKNTDKNILDNTSVIEKISKESLKVIETSQQLLDLNNRMELVEKRVHYLDEMTKKLFSETE